MSYASYLSRLPSLPDQGQSSIHKILTPYGGLAVALPHVVHAAVFGSVVHPLGSFITMKQLLGLSVQELLRNCNVSHPTDLAARLSDVVAPGLLVGEPVRTIHPFIHPCTPF